MKIYRGKDGRKRVYKKYDDGTKKVIAYARYLMEEKLGRKLRPDETVDHIDRDRGNDSVDNLRVISWDKHAKEDARRSTKVNIVCVLCEKTAWKNRRRVRGNAKQGKAGPFCGKSCAGKYGQMVQSGKIKPLPAQPIVELKYEYLEKSLGDEMANMSTLKVDA